MPAPLAPMTSGRSSWSIVARNFEGVRCPSCGAEIQGLWQETMDAGYQGGRFATLNGSTPCCGTATSLNDLACPPVGFSRFAIEVMNPDAGDEEADVLAKDVTEILGTPPTRCHGPHD